ncbi:MAG: OmpA family protein [Candidatus Omnitrophota bacterium]|nr:OmpA family protein [Candidatus Omnitrophota bacterium]
MAKKIVNYLILLVLIIPLTGCATMEGLRQKNREQSTTIVNLSNEVERLNTELDKLTMAKTELVKTKLKLEKKLQEEISRGDLKVKMEDRGVVVTMVAEVLFDSGKAAIKDPSKKTLQKVASVLSKGKTSDNFIYVEGHTDNVPIKYSGYKSNWELSTKRATEVLHFFIDKCKINPRRLAATGYGEQRPLVSNDTPEGRAKNRRVEVIISPDKIVKKRN